MTWQAVIVAAIVCACAAYLVRRWYRTFTGKAGGGCGCGDCPSAKLSSHPAMHRESKAHNTK